MQMRAFTVGRSVFSIGLMLLVVGFGGGCTKTAAVRKGAHPIDIGGQNIATISVGEIVVDPAVQRKHLGLVHGGAANIPYGSYSGTMASTLMSEYVPDTEAELRDAGYPVSEAGHASDFQLSGNIVKCKYNTYSSIFHNYAESNVEVEWALKDVKSGKIIFGADTLGKGQGPNKKKSPVAITEALRGSVRALLAERGFVDALSKPRS